jgi:hypothetical protein
LKNARKITNVAGNNNSEAKLSASQLLRERAFKIRHRYPWIGRGHACVTCTGSTLHNTNSYITHQYTINCLNI